jgi:hypothetical protein
MMTHFITEAWLKQYTPVSANVDATAIYPSTITAADMWVQSVLGTYFYNDLLVKYNNQTLNLDEEKLVEIIKPVVAWYAAVEAPITLSYQIKNKGPQKQSSDNSEALELNEIDALEQNFEKKAAFYLNQLKKYILKHKDLFPEYLSDDNDDSIIKLSKDEGDFNNLFAFV